MRNLQREAEALLERTGGETPSRRLRRQATELGGELPRTEQPGVADAEGRGERLLFGLERELMRRLKSVLERLDLPTRQELEALNERLLDLEGRMDEQPPKRAAKRKTPRRKPRRR